MCVLFSMTIRDEIWGCCGSLVTVFSLTRPKSSQLLWKSNVRRMQSEKPRILIAGIGNIFLGDDGFGVEVAQELSKCDFPASVHVADFGIRGFDLAYALQDGYETTILIDAFPHGQPPGTVYVVEPDMTDPTASLAQGSFVEPHAMNPMNVLSYGDCNARPAKTRSVGGV